MHVPARRGVHRFQTGSVDLTAKRTNDVLRKPDNLTSYRHSLPRPLRTVGFATIMRVVVDFTVSAPIVAFGLCRSSGGGLFI
jgi:hypothetical protein